MTGIRSPYFKLNQNLIALCAFDLVAQQGNFTRAADMLGISQSAISQRIRSLEIELGVVLFTREHRGVSLTNEGLRLFGVVSPAMKQLGNSVNSLLERKSKPRVRLSADFAFSTLWLLPRLAHLRSELGEEIELQILASQTPPEVNDDDCDISIHVIALNKMLDGDVLLLEEKVAAVCSPSFVESSGPIETPGQLLDTQLLSLSKPPAAEWQTWQGWFAGLGIAGERSRNYISFNNYDMLIQAALAGQGVALGWLGLVDDLLASGSLVLATQDVVTSRAGYVMSRDYTSLSTGPARVFDWIASHAADGRREV